VRTTMHASTLAIAAVMAIGVATQPLSFDWKIGVKDSSAFALSGGNGGGNGNGGGGNGNGGGNGGGNGDGGGGNGNGGGGKGDGGGRGGNGGTGGSSGQAGGAGNTASGGTGAGGAGVNTGTGSSGAASSSGSSSAGGRSVSTPDPASTPQAASDGGNRANGAGNGPRSFRYQFFLTCWWPPCGPVRLRVGHERGTHRSRIALSHLARAKPWHARQRNIAPPDSVAVRGGWLQLSVNGGAAADDKSVWRRDGAPPALASIGSRSLDWGANSGIPSQMALAAPKSELDPPLSTGSLPSLGPLPGPQELRAPIPRAFVAATGANQIQDKSIELQLRNLKADLLKTADHGAFNRLAGTAPLITAGQTYGDDPLIITERDAEPVYDCAGRDVTIEASHSKLFFSGICRSVIIPGSHDNVLVEIASHGKLTILGEDNVVISSSGPEGQEPIVLSTDESNTVIQFRSESDVTVPLVTIEATRLMSVSTSQ
jgi:hypothetical protein